MKFAAIDVGSNAVRLLLARFDPDGDEPIYNKVTTMRMPIRLGDDAFLHGRISDEKVEQLTKTMIGFSHIMDAFGPIDHMACGTSALRESKNSSRITKKIKKESGIDLDVISGKREARIIYSNHSMKSFDRKDTYLYIDVGGGSTEITVYHGHKVIGSRSFNIGAIRLLEGFVKKSEWAAMKSWVKKITSKHHPGAAIGSGGNINKVFRLSGTKEGKPIKYRDIKDVYSYLRAHTLEERIVKMGLKPDRADIIIPATRIYLSVMKWSDISYMHVPGMGLADGMVQLLYRKHCKKYENC